MKGTTLASLILLLIISLFISSTGAQETSFATILIYHKFNNPRSPSTSIDIETFEAQLKFLKEHNYNVLSMNQFLDGLKKGHFPPRSVLITIDDGYKSVFRYAFPVLKKYGFPFTVFLYMEGIGRYPDYMSISQVKELLSAGVTIGNHSYSHKRLARSYLWKDSDEYMSFIETDLDKSTERFRKLFGFTPQIYAYPYGEYNKDLHDLLMKKGYIAAFTQDPGSVSTDTDPFLVPRNAIVGSWATLEHLKKTLKELPITVSTHIPSYGILKENPLPEISFVIPSINRYRDFWIYVSELGWLKPEIDTSGKKIFIVNPPELKRKVNRVGIRAREINSGRLARFFYLVINPF